MTLFSDGVYLRLSDEAYFGQPRLGSTDLARLHRSPADWWYGSRHNPDREPEERSEERDFGKALHILLLEGEEEYRDRCIPSPFEDFRTKEARAWRDEQLFNGLTILTEDMDRRVRHMAALIANHPEFDEAFAPGGGLSEVAVLFTLEGVPVRAKFDRVLPRFDIDLKSYGGHVRGRDPKDKALRLVAERDMDVQRYLYDRAREAAMGFIAEGKIKGANADETAWLQKLRTVDDWSWVWIFYQRRDDHPARPRAPIVQPVHRARFDATFESGRQKVSAGLSNYRGYVSRFGLETPWALIEPLWTPADHEFPPWLTDTANPQYEDQAA